MRKYHRSDLHQCAASIPIFLLKFNELFFLFSVTAYSDLSICSKLEISVSCVLTHQSMWLAQCLQILFLLPGHLKFKAVEDLCSSLWDTAVLCARKALARAIEKCLLNVKSSVAHTASLGRTMSIMEIFCPNYLLVWTVNFQNKNFYKGGFWVNYYKGGFWGVGCCHQL